MRNVLVCLALALTVGTTGMFGQTVKASISGIVADSSGAIVSGATITVKDIDRGVRYSATSNNTGFYLVPELPSGNYQITAELTGFRTYVLDKFPLQTQQRASQPVRIPA